MASHKGPTEKILLMAARLSKIHVAFTVIADPLGSAILTLANQGTLNALIEQQRNQDEDDKLPPTDIFNRL